MPYASRSSSSASFYVLLSRSLKSMSREAPRVTESAGVKLISIFERKAKPSTWSCNSPAQGLAEQGAAATELHSCDHFPAITFRSDLV